MIAAHATHMSSNLSADGTLSRWSGPSWGGRAAMDWLLQSLCGLRGHAMMLHFESSRLSLRCMSCGHTTPGWTIQESQREF